MYALTLKVTGRALQAKENSSCLRRTNIEQGATEGGSKSLNQALCKNSLVTHFCTVLYYALGDSLPGSELSHQTTEYKQLGKNLDSSLKESKSVLLKH